MDSSAQPGREVLIGDFMQAIARLSTWTVMFHQVASLRLGLHPTDGKALHLLQEMGSITAGELAMLTGLTTGAITGVLDRLEQHGFVRRAADPQDRRRVVIELVPEAMNRPELAAIYGPLAEATIQDLLARYDDEALALVLDFVQRGAVLMQQQTARLRQPSVKPRA
jgi:DNA-binding MarR family transcriptional regulator